MVWSPYDTETNLTSLVKMVWKDDTSTFSLKKHTTQTSEIQRQITVYILYLKKSEFSSFFVWFMGHLIRQQHQKRYLDIDLTKKKPVQTDFSWLFSTDGDRKGIDKYGTIYAIRNDAAVKLLDIIIICCWCRIEFDAQVDNMSRKAGSKLNVLAALKFLGFWIRNPNYWYFTHSFFFFLSLNNVKIHGSGNCTQLKQNVLICCVRFFTASRTFYSSLHSPIFTHVY